LFGSTATLGQTSFAPTKVVSNAIQPVSVLATDIDNDGYNDIVCSKVSYEGLVWIKNNGNGNFDTSRAIANTNYFGTIHTADIDNDGDKDVISASNDYNIVAWFENDGIGNFTEHIIGTNLNMLYAVYTTDIDNDGDNDVLLNFSHYIAWFENDGIGNFGTEQIILGYFVGYSLPTDIDNDGDNDIVTLPFTDSPNLAWLKNNGYGNFNEEQIIDTVQAYNFLSTDLDNDGDNDVVSLFYPEQKPMWYENNGNGDFGEIQIIDTNIDSEAPNLSFVDLDNDGDNDIMAILLQDNGLYYDMVWYENDGTANFSEKKIIGECYWISSIICTADLDNDGDNDIITSNQYNQLGWFENLLYTVAPPPPLSSSIAAFTTTPSPQTIDTLRICKGQSVSFLNQSENANAYVWNFGDGTTTTQNSPQHSFQETGTYTVSLVTKQNNIVECKADAGNLIQLINDPTYYITNYNDSPNYNQTYLYFDSNGARISSNNWWWWLSIGATTVAAINYPTTITLDINTLDELNNFANNTGCIDMNIYDACELHGIHVSSYYSTDYGGYVIDVLVDYISPLPFLHIETNNGNENIGLLASYDTGVAYDIILGNEAGTAFAPGETATVCPFRYEEPDTISYYPGSCCKTFIFPDTIPGGGNQDHRIFPKSQNQIPSKTPAKPKLPSNSPATLPTIRNKN
jgi:hypothetical protein